MFSSIDRVTAEIRERSQQLQNLEQKYAFLGTEVLLSVDELNFDEAPQDQGRSYHRINDTGPQNVLEKIVKY
ncbi:hypothetical protein TNCV_2009441 [Trichonephila clavipes]|nr:hypothetical protein TNCV_2009441 [Trichonephila clavipes]